MLGIMSDKDNTTAVPKNFSLSSSKVSYMISYAIVPYFHKMLIDDIKISNSPILLLYDETTNAQHLKQLDFQVRYNVLVKATRTS